MAGQLTIDTLRASSGVLATQNGMTGIAKAWVQFAGSTATINGSFNVSSITRSSQGKYTMTFTTAMPNANYCVASLGSSDASTAGQMPCVWTVDSTQTTTTYTIRTGRPSIPGVTTELTNDLVNINLVVFSS